MSAEILPFPSIRRVGQIRRTAAYMASVSEAVAEGHLRREVARLAGSLAARQIPAEVIEAEVRAYCLAVERAAVEAKLGLRQG